MVAKRIGASHWFSEFVLVDFLFRRAAHCTFFTLPTSFIQWQLGKCHVGNLKKKYFFCHVFHNSISGYLLSNESNLLK